MAEASSGGRLIASTSRDGCIFCAIAQGALPAAVVAESAEFMAIMDRYPATAGHLLLLPKQHIENVFELPERMAGRLMAQAVALAKAMQRQLAPGGLNLIQANGGAAGQTISHFHLHLVPRYSGDGVVLQFGHGSTPAQQEDLEQIASLIKAGLDDPEAGHA